MTKPSKVKNIIIAVLCGVLLVSSFGLSFKIFNSVSNDSATTSPASSETVAFVEITKDSGQLDDSQLALLSKGTLIKQGEAIYQLTTAQSDVLTFRCLSDVNTAQQRYLDVSLNKKTYALRSEKSDLIFASDLENYVLSSELKKYVLSSELNDLVSSSDLENYASVSDLLKYALTSDLNLFVTITNASGTFSADDIDKLNKGAVIVYDNNVYQLSGKNSSAWYYSCSNSDGIGNKVIKYSISNSKYSFTDENLDITPIVSNRIQLASGIALTFEGHSIYFVQCYDSSWNLAKMEIVGGGKASEQCEFALVITGGQDSNYTESLILYSTGSVLINNLAGTSGDSTGLKPVSSTSRLSYFKISGNGIKK